MAKADLVERVQSQLNEAGFLAATKSDVAVTIDAVFKAVAEELRDGAEVNIVGFGRFTVQHKPERTVKVFGELKAIPAHGTLKFKPASALKQAVA